MKKIIKDASIVYKIVRRIDAKNLSSELRAKMIHNTVETKKAQKVLDELVKDLREHMTEEEHEAMKVVGCYEQCGQRVPVEKMAEMAVVISFNKIIDKELEEVGKEEIDIDWKELSADDIDKLCENNGLSLDELALLTKF